MPERLSERGERECEEERRKGVNVFGERVRGGSV